MSLESLERDGSLERVSVDLEAAARLLRDAQTHIVSAEKLAADDPSGAYQLAYDAARKAAAAHMAGRGFRVRPRQLGAHVIVARYAEGAVDAPEARHLDRMRRTRNRAEYDALEVGQAQVAADLEHARAIVDAVTRELAPEGSAL